MFSAFSKKVTDLNFWVRNHITHPVIDWYTDYIELPYRFAYADHLWVRIVSQTVLAALFFGSLALMVPAVLPGMAAVYGTLDLAILDGRLGSHQSVESVVGLFALGMLLMLGCMGGVILATSLMTPMTRKICFLLFTGAATCLFAYGASLVDWSYAPDGGVILCVMAFVTVALSLIIMRMPSTYFDRRRI